MTNQPPPDTTKATRSVTLRRTYLIERIQDYTLQIPADYDVEEWLVNDFAGLNDRLTDDGTLIFEDYEHVEHDDLDLTVIQP